MDTINVINVGGVDKEIEDTTARTKIEQIIAPSGGAPNPDEIIDARIGDDNTIYNNLGTAIRKPNADIKRVLANGVHNIDNDINISYTPFWIAGKDLDSQSGEVVDNVDFAITDYIDHSIVDGLRVTVSGQGTRLYIYQYNEYKDFMSDKKITITASGTIDLDSTCAFARFILRVSSIDKVGFAVPSREVIDISAREDISSFIDDVKRDTDNGTNIVDGEGNVLFYPLWRDGDLDSDTGDIIPSGNFIACDFIDKSRINGAKVVTSSTETNLYVYQYDWNHVLMSDKKIVINGEAVLSLENTCNYVRMTTKKTNFGLIKIIMTKIPPDYFSEWKISNNSEWEFVRELGDINSETGQDQPDNSFLRSKGYVDADSIFGLKISSDGASVYTFLYDENKNYLTSYSKNSSYIFKKTVGAKYVRFVTRLTNISQKKITFERPLEIAKAEELRSIIPIHEISFNIMDYMDVGAGNLRGTIERNKDTRVNVRPIKVVKNSYYTIHSGDGLYAYEYDDDFNLIKRVDHPSLGEKVYTDYRTRYLRFETTNDLRTPLNVTIISEKPYPELVYDKYRGYDTIMFYYNVFTNHKTDVLATDIDTDITTEGTWTSGCLRLPPNYNPNGDKVPLVYFVHGSGDYHSIYISSGSDMSSLYMPYIQYLQDEGFAVFDCFANTIIANSAGNGCEWGVPTNIAAARQGIEYCCKNFNIDPNSIFVMSKSLGGLVAINMCYEAGMNIKACCPLAPELDMACASLGYNINVRKFNAQDMSFSEDVNNVLETPFEAGVKEYSWQQNEDYKNYLRENAKHMSGYNPAWRGVLGVDPDEMIEYSLVNDRPAYGTKLASQSRYCAVPTKIFIAEDDPAVSYEMSAGYIQSLKNCGCVGELRSLPVNSGKHHAVDTEGPKVSSIKTKTGILHTNVPLAYVEAVQFFNKYK